jgi:hypothetical protein
MIPRGVGPIVGEPFHAAALKPEFFPGGSVFGRKTPRPHDRLTAKEECRPSTPKSLSLPVMIRKTNHPQIIYAHAMEIALTVMLAFVGIACCAIVMIAMWGPEALAFRKRSRQKIK